MNGPTHPSTEDPPVTPRPCWRRFWPLATVGIVAALALLSWVAGRWTSGTLLSREADDAEGAPPGHRSIRDGTGIASFRADFQPEQPKAGWHYYWNAAGPVGDASSYAELRWNGKLYGTDDPKQYPAPAPARYLRLTGGSGHPGQGTSQGHEAGNEEERAVIVGFTVPKAGRYRLVNGVVSRQAGPRSGNVHLQVWAGDREVEPGVYCRSREGVTFDRDLGTLPAGETIYVSVGPDETDVDDSFDLDFTIAR